MQLFFLLFDSISMEYMYVPFKIIIRKYLAFDAVIVTERQSETREDKSWCIVHGKKERNPMILQRDLCVCMCCMCIFFLILIIFIFFMPIFVHTAIKTAVIQYFLGHRLYLWEKFQPQ